MDNNIPIYAKLIKSAYLFQKISDLIKIEGKILAILNWKLQFSTGLDRIEYFLSQGILFSDDLIKNEKISSFQINNKNALKEKNINQNIINVLENDKINSKKEEISKAEKINEENHSENIKGFFENTKLIEETLEKIEKNYLKLSNLILKSKFVYFFY